MKVRKWRIRSKTFSKKNHRKETVEQSKIELEFLQCKQRSFTEFDQGYFCQNCEFMLIKPKHQIVEKIRREKNTLSETLPYANTKFKQVCYCMMVIKYE